MVIMIPIPIGVRRVAAVRGAVWQHVCCGQCQQRYAYMLELEATGEDHDLLFLDGAGSAKRALAEAEQNLWKKSQNVVLPVPCPNCGHYQDDMARRLKEDASINGLQIAGGVITLFSLVPLAFDIAYVWVLSSALALAGLIMVGCGLARAFRFDPNAGDPEPRKVLGRRNALWGEQLAELLAAVPPPEDAAATPHSSGSQGAQ